MTCIFCKKSGLKCSFLPEIWAWTFYFPCMESPPPAQQMKIQVQISWVGHLTTPPPPCEIFSSTNIFVIRFKLIDKNLLQHHQDVCAWSRSMDYSLHRCVLECIVVWLRRWFAISEENGDEMYCKWWCTKGTTYKNFSKEQALANIPAPGPSAVKEVGGLAGDGYMMGEYRDNISNISGHLVIWSFGHLVICSFGHLVIF